MNSQEGLFLGCVTQINPHTSLSVTKDCNRNWAPTSVKYVVYAEKMLVSVCWTEQSAGGAGMASTSSTPCGSTQNTRVRQGQEGKHT